MAACLFPWRCRKAYIIRRYDAARKERVLKMEQPKVSVRMTVQEHKEIKKRARMANQSVNRYLIDSGLGSVPQNDKILSDLMGELCKLELCIQKATDLETLKNDVQLWRRRTITMLGGSVAWHS